jgi:hypothetical protein
MSNPSTAGQLDGKLALVTGGGVAAVLGKRPHVYLL